MIEQARLQAESGAYDEAWSTYREFRDSLDGTDYDAKTLELLDEAERAAESSLRRGAVGFESDIETLLFLAQRLVEPDGTER